MSLVSTPGQGQFFPAIPPQQVTASGGSSFFAITAAGTMDAAGEKVALQGHLCMAGRATGKTLSSGGGKIHVRLGTVTFADAGSSLTVGVQDISTGAGPVMQPDGVFDASVTLAGAGQLTSSAWNTFTVDSGTKTLSHGDKIAVVFDLTARAGTDSIVVAGNGLTLGANMPCVATFTAAWTATPGLATPVVILEMDDGTLATLSETFPFTIPANTAYSSSSTPDEYAMLFSLPYGVEVDGLWGAFYAAANTADCELVLYADPLGTPQAIATYAVDGNWVGASLSRLFFGAITPVVLAANTTYAVALKATGAGNVTMPQITYRNANDRGLVFGDTVQRGQRSNGSGAFGTLSTIEHPILGIRISKIHNGAGDGASFLIGM